MSLSKFDDILTKGIATDTFLADLNYHVYKKILERNTDILKLDEPERKLFKYIKINAKENTVLSIARIFDSKSHRFKTRCLDELLIHASEVSITYPFDIFPDHWDKFRLKYSELLGYADHGDKNPKDFISLFTKIYSNIKETEKSFQHLKIWRDKILAHNEPYDSSELNIDFNEIEFLIMIPKAIIEYASQFMDTGNSLFMFDGKDDSYFIDGLISKYVG